MHSVKPKFRCRNIKIFDFDNNKLLSVNNFQESYSSKFKILCKM